MRILHVVASLSPEWGGPVKMVQGLTDALIKKGIEITIFAPVNKEHEDNIIHPKGANVQLFKQTSFSKIWTAYSPSLMRALYEEAPKFDIIHIHEIWHFPHFAAYHVARKLKKPFIITPHGALAPWCLNYKAFKKKIFTLLIQKRILNQATVLHALTAKEAEYIRDFGVKNQIEVIPNGINVEEFKDFHPSQNLERVYPDLKDKKVIMFLGRIHSQKGLDIIAQAFGAVARNRDDVRLLIVGPDSNGYQKQIETILKEEKVFKKTIFTGILTGTKKMAALSRANISILPSYSEGFSMAILEAMVCGLPVIISDQCNFPQVLENRAGIIIKPNAQELAKALIELLNNSQLCDEMGKNGRKLVLEKFTWDKIANKMMDLYKSLLSGKMINKN